MMSKTALGIVMSLVLLAGAGEAAAAPERAPTGGGKLTRLEDLLGLPCGAGADAGTVSLAINPLSRAVSLACPRLGEFQLDVAVSGPGAVASVPPGIECGSGLGACTNGYAGGTLVTLTAAHEADVAAFIGWGGACSGTDATCQVTMDAARQVTATFAPTLSVTLTTSASSREQSCALGFCVLVDLFTNSFARVTVRDLDTGTVAGTCDADTTLVVPVGPGAFPSINTTTCHVPVVTGHHLRLEAEDSSTLGGTQNFVAWSDELCSASTDPTCTPAGVVTVHKEVAAGFF
jgi:hypothetical protein